jgi:NADH-quinone oxidoreductase subunit A
MTPLAAYLLLFVAVGVGFIFVHLMAGKLIRPNKPYAAKRTIYECGEPTIGSAWIQFDLRFYVVALLFVIFDVEVAFFFPWAVVFGKANAVAAVGPPNSAERYHETAEHAWELVPPTSRPEHLLQYNHVMEMTKADVAHLAELRAKRAEQRAAGSDLSTEELVELGQLANREEIVIESQRQGRSLGWLALLEIAVFFGVLLVGYAYLWRRGDLAWVRSLAAERQTAEPMPSPTPPIRQATAKPLAETAAHS